MDRRLPSRDVTEDTFTKAYVNFILYCNPHFPLSVDTNQLEEKFNAVPRSDNKEFKTWRLFELIQRFDAKEIDTWGQLALELGVEPPDASKQQSIQKVQQYTVRLKRWMRAMHIDAFFEWLLGKQMDYVEKIPPIHDPYPREGRDGVIAEEDLAIRALEPAFRPKRGRRRNSDTEEVDRPRTLVEESPATAHPSSGYRYHPPWGGVLSLAPNMGMTGGSATQPTAPHLRWQESDVLQSPHPSSAIPTGSREDPYFGEPMSAVTPSTRKRRKHGPAVSSAWPSAIAEGAKPRGRPPASRVMQDGPYGTFPVQRSVEEPHLGSPYAGHDTAMPPPVAQMGRPQGLSLTVPQRTGNPVRLATPPRLMVSNDSRATSEAEPTIDTPRLLFETMKRALTSDLLRGELTGRPTRLTLEEAKQLADVMLVRLNVPRMDDGNPSTQTQRLTAASWLGLGDQLNIPVGPATGLQKKISVTRFRKDEEGYEIMIPCAEETNERVKSVFDVRWQATQGYCQAGFQLTNMTFNLEGRAVGDVDNIHDLIINRVMSAAKEIGLDNETGYLPQRARQSVKKYASGVNEAMGIDKQDEQINWREKFRMLEFGSSIAHGEFDRYRAVMLQKILDVFLQ